MNDTLQMLCKMTWRFQREREQSDPQWAAYNREFQTLYRRFRAQHPHNRALIRQVNDLLDTQGNQSEYEGERWFLLGLQIGLELGNLNQLREL